MKQIFLFILPLFISSHFAFGQSIDELSKRTDSLNVLVEKINLQIDLLNNRKDNLKRQLAVINQKKNKLELEKESLEGMPATINYMGGTLRDKPNVAGNEIIKIPTGDTVLIFNWYEKPYFKAAYKEKVGYISSSSLDKSEKINAIISKELANKNPKLARLINKYGNYNAQRILKGEYWIGMTAKMARESVGYPDDINKSTGSWGVHEQWIYEKKDLYLYFENGKLTSIQD